MVKKWSFLVVLILVFSLCSPFGVYAAETGQGLSSDTGTVVSETTEYFEDGSSLTTVVVDESVSLSRAAAITKKGRKTVTARNKDGDELFCLMVHGTFSVEMGVSSTCTSSSYSALVTDTAWFNESAAAYRSGNQAIAEAKFIRKVLFITVESKDMKAVLTCNKNGVFS